MIFLTDSIKSSENLVVITKSRVLSSKIKSIDEDGAIARAIEISKFKGEAGESLFVPVFNKTQSILFIGANNSESSINIGSAIFKALSSKNIQDAVVVFEEGTQEEKRLVANGIELRDYNFSCYKSKKEDKNIDVKINLFDFNLGLEDIEEIKNVSKSVKFARDLVNTPPCDLYPATFVQKVQEELKGSNVNIKVLKGSDLNDMGALVGVGKASSNEPYVLVLEYDVKDGKPIDYALVGKGVTYDSGGLSLKPSTYMETMKSDMSGAAVVVSSLKAIADAGVKKSVVGIVGLVENMVSANSYKPDDIVKTRSGQTVEVLNTDAEGRLVLADIMDYVQDIYKPSHMIDLATLTGAIVVGLGHVYAGAFSNDCDLANAIVNSGLNVEEKIWRMPLHKRFSDSVKSDIADLQNIEKRGTGGGSSVAAAFLQYFVKKDVKWVHLDIAGVSHLGYEDFASAKGATGFGVRLLFDLLKNS